jgi:hypothetical protein
MESHQEPWPILLPFFLRILFPYLLSTTSLPPIVNDPVGIAKLRKVFLEDPYAHLGYYG